MKKQKNLKGFLFSIIFILAVVPVIMLATISLINDRRATNTDYEENANTLLNIAQGIIETKVNGYKSTLESLLSEANFDDLELLEKDFILLDKSDSSILNIYFAKKDTKNFVQSIDQELPEDYDVNKSLWYINALENTNDFYIGSPYTDSVTGKSVIPIAKAVEVNNEILGVISMDVELTELSEQLSTLKYGTTGEFIINSEDGLTISNTDKSKVGGLESTEYEVWDEILNNESGKIVFNYNSKKYEGYYNTSQDTGWKMILKTESNELRSNELKQMIITVILVAIMIIIVLIVSLSITKIITNIINSLLEKLHDASEGKFEMEINVNSPIKEFRLLEESFNSMRNNLGNLIGQVNKSVNNIDFTVSDSLKMSEDISASIEQVTNTISEISVGTNQSANGLEQISSDITILSSEMNQIEDVVENVNNMARETNNLGQKGIEIVKLVLDKSNDTRKSTEEVSEVVIDVSNSILKIENINSTITSITEQTNLLALNAAIEAARAGEAGRGFSIVADAIRKLAEETADSAGQIDLIIREISQKSKDAVDKVDNTSRVVKEQEEAVLESERIFGEIVTSVEELDSKFNNITSGIGKINKMKDNIVGKVEDLSAVLEETAAGTEEVTASSEEISSSTEKFVSNFSELRDKSSDLKVEVSKFKV